MFSASRRSRHNHLQEEPLRTTAGSLLELLTFSTVENQYGPRPFVLPALPGGNIFLRLVLTSLPGRRFATTSHPSGLTRYPHVHHIDRHTRLGTEIPQHLPALMSRDWTEAPAWTNQRMYSSDRNTQWQRTQQHLEEASTMPPPPPTSTPTPAPSPIRQQPLSVSARVPDPGPGGWLPFERAA